MGKFKQGFYTPLNPEKWILPKSSITKGNGIRYMSSWELKVMKFFDLNPQILNVSSEPFAIPYISPKDNKIHRYFPDFIVKTESKVFLVEVKPLHETLPPKLPKRKTEKSYKNYLKALETYNINYSKWESARKFCLENNIEFKILTENEIKV